MKFINLLTTSPSYMYIEKKRIKIDSPALVIFSIFHGLGDARMSIRTDLNFQRVICNDEPEEDDRRDRYQGLEGGGVEILLQGTEKGRGKGQTEQ